MKKEKWLFALWGVFVIVGTAIAVWIKEYSDILWIVNVTFLLWWLYNRSKLIKDLNKTIADQCDIISNLESTWSHLHIVDLEKQAECALANCKKYLGRIGELKAENEELKTLNKNLIEITYNQKAKKHGKATKPRKCKE